MIKLRHAYCLIVCIGILCISCKTDSKSANERTATTQKTEQKVDPISDSKEIVQEAEVDKSEIVTEPKVSKEEVEKKEIKKPKPKITKQEKQVNKVAEQAPPTKKAIYAKPAIEFETMTHDFGKLEEGETYDYAFKFKNTGNAPLEIISASGTCGCAQPSFPFLEIAPGATNQIGVHYNSVNKEGDQNPEIFVSTNVNRSKIKITLTGTVIVTEERRKEKEAAIAKQKAAIAKAAEESKKRREAQEKITKARVDSILQVEKDTSRTIDKGQ